MTSEDGKADTTEKAETVDTDKVHSANSWETVNLGDEERKKKFLRLMGASSQKQHLGRFVIGDRDEQATHARENKETEVVTKELEDQFVHSQEHKITKWSHHGLGFSKDDQTTTESAPVLTKEGEKPAAEGGGDTATESSVDTAKSDNKSDEKSERKRESVDAPAPEEQSVPKKPKMMMSFVKSSD